MVQNGKASVEQTQSKATLLLTGETEHLVAVHVSPPHHVSEAELAHFRLLPDRNSTQGEPMGDGHTSMKEARPHGRGHLGQRSKTWSIANKAKATAQARERCPPTPQRARPAPCREPRRSGDRSTLFSAFPRGTGFPEQKKQQAAHACLCRRHRTGLRLTLWTWVAPRARCTANGSKRKTDAGTLRVPDPRATSSCPGYSKTPVLPTSPIAAGGSEAGRSVSHSTHKGFEDKETSMSFSARGRKDRWLFCDRPWVI